MCRGVKAGGRGRRKRAGGLHLCAIAPIMPARMTPAADRRAPAIAQDATLLAIRLFFILLVCGDLVFIAIHVGHITTPALRGAHYSLETDGGLAEFYQYMKQFWLTLCLATAYFQRRELPFLCWSGLFGFLLLDDALQIHERAGRWLGQALGLPAVFGLRPDDLGELIVAGVVGGVLLVTLAVTQWRHRGPSWRASRDLLILTGALASCGVLLDTVHVVAYFRLPAFSTFLALLEDGGEMLIVSALTAYAFNLVLHGGNSRLNLWRVLRGQSRARQSDRPGGEGGDAGMDAGHRRTGTV